MTRSESDDQLRGYQWMESRIPATDALATFILDDDPQRDQFSNELHARYHRSRWFPKEGGHEVLVPYDGGDFDRTKLSKRDGAWDHEHCDLCSKDIPAMTLCWVTRNDPYVLVCVDCYAQRIKSKPWWRFW